MAEIGAAKYDEFAAHSIDFVSVSGRTHCRRRRRRSCAAMVVVEAGCSLLVILHVSIGS